MGAIHYFLYYGQWFKLLLKEIKMSSWIDSSVTLFRKTCWTWNFWWDSDPKLKDHHEICYWSFCLKLRSIDEKWGSSNILSEFDDVFASVPRVALEAVLTVHVSDLFLSDLDTPSHSLYWHALETKNVSVYTEIA